MRWYIKIWDVLDEGPTEYGPFETRHEADNFAHDFEDYEIYEK